MRSGVTRCEPTPACTTEPNMRSRDISEANLTSHLRPEPGTSQRPLQNAVPDSIGSSWSSATSEDLGTNARFQPLAAKRRASANGPRVSWWWMTPHAGTCMSPRRNEPSGYELGNLSLVNLAVWVELPSEIFVCDGTPLLFSLSCGVRHLMQVQGSLAVPPCGPLLR